MDEKDRLSELKNEIRELIRLNFVLPEDIPDIELYMDQVTRFMDTHLHRNSRGDGSEDKPLTKTMINNYIKNKLLPPPEKKRYTKEHIIMLISIYYLKNFISISDIQKMLGPMTEKYFDKKDEKGRGLLEIYEEIFELGRRQYFNIENSILRAKEITDLKMADEDEYLNKLVFIYMLAYDIYGKKRLMEQLIDEIDEAEMLKAEADGKKTRKKPVAKSKAAAKGKTAAASKGKAGTAKSKAAEKKPDTKATAAKAKTAEKKLTAKTAEKKPAAKTTAKSAAAGKTTAAKGASTDKTGTRGKKA